LSLTDKILNTDEHELKEALELYLCDYAPKTVIRDLSILLGYNKDRARRRSVRGAEIELPMGGRLNEVTYNRLLKSEIFKMTDGIIFTASRLDRPSISQIIASMPTEDKEAVTEGYTQADKLAKVMIGAALKIAGFSQRTGMINGKSKKYWVKCRGTEDWTPLTRLQNYNYYLEIIPSMIKQVNNSKGENV